MRSVQVNPYSDTIVDKAKTTTPTSAARLSRLAAGKPAVPKRPAAEHSSAAPAPRPTSTAQGRPLIRASVAPKPAAVQARSPNQHQHVLSVRAAAAPTPRSSATRNSSAMPIGDKPRQPQLSAGAGPGVARGSTRAPLTPKVAVRGQAATTTATTATARRSGSSINGAQSPRSDVSSVAASSYLSHSTTPRSGTRQTRAESTHSTPNSTPNLDKLSDGWETRSNRSSRGLGVSPLARTDNAGSRKSIGNSSNGPGDDSKFFYASSIKPAAPTSHPPRPASVVHTKSTPTFFYASDAASKRVTSPPAYPSSSSNSLSSAQEGVATKFFYANGVPDADVRLSARSSGSGSTVSSGSRAPRPNTSASSVAGSSTVQVHSRPASPSKNLAHPTLPPQQHHHHHHQQSPRSIRTGAMSPTSPVRSSVHPSPTLAGSASQVGKRRVSIEAPLRLKQGHARAGSVHSIDGVVTPKVATPTIAPPMIHAPDMTPPLLSPGLAQLSQPVTMATILQMADELEDEEDEGSEGEDGEDGHSDDSGSDSRSHKRLSQNSEPLDHLVLSARRERKVQDLEITNASLEAINRTLERQMRKQSAELRRFRRLSRAGRLPTATNQGASLSVPDASGGLADVSEKEEDAKLENQEYDDDEDEDEDEEEEEEEEEEDEDSLVDSELSNENAAADSKSTDPQAKTDSPSAKRRKRDERRLQLDLTRHQELLLDSQKMNQSLKKCLNWTDLLIKEGQKALAYRVKIADVDAMPGRVLAASYYDYREDTSQAGDDTISTVSASHFGDDTISIAESETWAKEAQDRDSGIELRAAGH
ncbi:hypothetical protein MKX08_009089 [Trichoderma sp. CBMAI-0020]|nr:hypothetical protein MKX08_009089 [Trichoderma sp. CBMAI-0020]